MQVVFYLKCNRFCSSSEDKKSWPDTRSWNLCARRGIINMGHDVWFFSNLRFQSSVHGDWRVVREWEKLTPNWLLVVLMFKAQIHENVLIYVDLIFAILEDYKWLMKMFHKRCSFIEWYCQGVLYTDARQKLEWHVISSELDKVRRWQWASLVSKKVSTYRKLLCERKLDRNVARSGLSLLPLSRLIRLSYKLWNK